MTSLHRLIAIGCIWFALASAAIVTNSSTSVWLMAGLWVTLVNVAYIVAALVATFLVLRVART